MGSFSTSCPLLLLLLPSGLAWALEEVIQFESPREWRACFREAVRRTSSQHNHRQHQELPLIVSSAGGSSLRVTESMCRDPEIHPCRPSSHMVICAQPRFPSLGTTIRPAIARNFASSTVRTLVSPMFNFLAVWSNRGLEFHIRLHQLYEVTWPLGQGGSMKQDKHLH